MCLGFIVLLVVEYATLFQTGLLFTPKEPLNTIVAIQFVPLLATVGAIAARWGMLDAPSFSRAFRDAYGLSPREYRMRALGDEDLLAGS